MADRNSKAASKSARPEPGPILWVLADQFYTLVFVAGLVTALSAWVMWDSVSAGGVIQPHMYVILGLGLGVLGCCGVLYLGRSEDLETVWRRTRALKEGKLLLKEVQRGKRRYAHRLNQTQVDELSAAESNLDSALTVRDWDRLATTLNQLDDKLDAHLAFARKSTAREYAESIGVAVLVALFLRSFVVEAFRIPSGSMIPTLQVGDHIFVNKFIYGLRIPFTDIKLGMQVRKPQRGEVIVFKFPLDRDKDFIKRIVAIEGDTVEMRGGVVHINGQPIEHQRKEGKPCEYDDKVSEDTDRWMHRECVAYTERLDAHEFTAIYDHREGPRNFPATKVPPGHVFVMGDNRDNSHDSRYWGFVPFELIKGKAIVIWWSAGQPEGIRIRRMGHLVD